MQKTLLVGAAVGLSASASAQTLTMAGGCPGAIDVTVEGLTPEGIAVFLSGGAGEGDDVIGFGRCTGTVTGLAGIRFMSRLVADGDGRVRARPGVRADGCDRPIQVLDISTCTVSNVATAADGGGGGGSDAPHLSEPFVAESDSTWWCGGTGISYTNYGFLTFDECQDIANRTGTNWYGGVSSPIAGPFWIGEDGPDTAVIGSDGYWTDEIVVSRDDLHQCVLGIYDRRSDPSEFPEEELYVDGEGRTWHFWSFAAQTHAQAMAWASDVGGRIINPNSVGRVGTLAFTIPTHQCHAGAEFNGGGTCNSDNICNFYVGFFE